MKHFLKTPFMLALVVLLVLVALAGATTAQEGIPQCEINDKRVNNRPHRDCGAPVVIYEQRGAFAVLQPPTGPGPAQPIMFIPINDDIPTGANRVIDQATNPYNGREVVASRLTTGEYQLNTLYSDGTPYIIVWYQGAMDIYSLDPVTGEPLDGAQPITVPGGSGAPASAPPVAAPDSDSPAADDDTAEAAPVVIPPGETITVGDNCRVRITRIVRLRAEPSTSSDVVSRLPFNTTWQVTQATAGWFRVIYQDTQGWVSADYAEPTVGCGF